MPARPGRAWPMSSHLLHGIGLLSHARDFLEPQTPFGSGAPFVLCFALGAE